MSSGARERLCNAARPRWSADLAAAGEQSAIVAGEIFARGGRFGGFLHLRQ
jgi:hypothetical protein